MRTDEARDLIAGALQDIVPDADVRSLPQDADLRESLELDSLDFVTFVERLSDAARVRIDEEDYSELRTLEDATGFLVTRAASAGRS